MEEYNNVFYFKKISEIGGTESFLYYLSKKYKKYDIVVFYKIGDLNQILRLKKYVRVIQYTNQKIKCKKAFFNYNPDIIENVEAEEYIQILHTDYKKQGFIYNKHPKITKFIGVSKSVCDSFKEYTGYDCELCYNPIELDKSKKVLKLISTTRLTHEKGKDRMIKFANILDNANVPYLWLIFTNDVNVINNPNIIYLRPRLDISDFVANSDYLVQLSDEGEGYRLCSS